MEGLSGARVQCLILLRRTHRLSVLQFPMLLGKGQPWFLHSGEFLSGVNLPSSRIFQAFDSSDVSIFHGWTWRCGPCSCGRSLNASELNMEKPIVVVGSINMDLVATTMHLPAPGETVFGDQFNTFFGGKGANQAVAAAKLGYPVTMIGKVGEDVFGLQLLDGLKHVGVEVRCIDRVPGASGTSNHRH